MNTGPDSPLQLVLSSIVWDVSRILKWEGYGSFKYCKAYMLNKSSESVRVFFQASVYMIVWFCSLFYVNRNTPSTSEQSLCIFGGLG